MRELVLLMLLWQAGAQAPIAAPQFFQYQRAVAMEARTGGEAGQACAALDAAVYAHAATALRDVRLHADGHEVPYAITLSQPLEAESEPARVVNLGHLHPGQAGGKIVFDLEMPARAYTDVVLDLAERDFVGTAEVSGSSGADTARTALGSFTVFDLSAQRLGRSTTLHLQESRFPVLHVAIAVSAAPGAPSLDLDGVTVRGASVPPSREAQTVYTTVAEAASIQQRGRATVARFHLPAYVPVERVRFEVARGFSGSFSRNVTISDGVLRERGARSEDPEPVESVHGTIERVRVTEAGREIRQEQMSVPATLGANLQRDAEVDVTVENGDDAPLPLTAVRLEMRERKVCFPAQAQGTALTLFYGDAALEAPVYDFGRVLSLASDVGVARLGPEARNPRYVARSAPARSVLERHPELVWVGLLAVVCALAMVALHSAKRMPR